MKVFLSHILLSIIGISDVQLSVILIPITVQSRPVTMSTFPVTEVNQNTALLELQVHRYPRVQGASPRVQKVGLIPPLALMTLNINRPLS